MTVAINESNKTNNTSTSKPSPEPVKITTPTLTTTEKRSEATIHICGDVNKQLVGNTKNNSK